MMHHLYYAGRSSAEFGIYISGSGVYNAPERDVEKTSIPGRSGDLTTDNNRFGNITVEYPAFIRREFSQNAEAARAWLLMQKGYQRLEDTYHPKYYRKAQFIGPMEFDMHTLNRSGEVTIAFDCMPQRWEKEGEKSVQIANNGILKNNAFPALPLVKVSGTAAGNLYIGSYAVQIKSIDGYVMLDSENKNAYKETQNKNNTIYTENFPVLEPGNNQISWDGGITAVEITPRWWTI